MLGVRILEALRIVTRGTSFSLTRTTMLIVKRNVLRSKLRLVIPEAQSINVLYDKSALVLPMYFSIK